MGLRQVSLSADSNAKKAVARDPGVDGQAIESEMQSWSQKRQPRLLGDAENGIVEA